MSLVSGFLLLVLSMAAPKPTPADSLGPRVTGRLFDGVIVATGYQEWTPTRAQVVELEKALPAYVASRRKDRGSLSWGLAEYKRVYKGLEIGGKRLILINFFHRSTDIVKSGQWLRELILVDGGGQAFLEARYDPASHSFVDFSMNGPY